MAPEFRITRRFAAPRDRVWDAWTRPEQLARWFGPKGVTTTVLSFDLRPGGGLHPLGLCGVELGLGVGVGGDDQIADQLALLRIKQGVMQLDRLEHARSGQHQAHQAGPCLALDLQLGQLCLGLGQLGLHHLGLLHQGTDVFHGGLSLLLPCLRGRGPSEGWWKGPPPPPYRRSPSPAAQGRK